MNQMLKNALLFGWAAGLVWVGCTVEDDGDDDDTSSSTSSTGSSTGSSTSSSSSSSSSSTSTSTSTSTTSTGGAITYDCNPVTNEGCDSNSACDFSESNAYVCFPHDNLGICETCNQGSGPWCAPGMHCRAGDDICRKYCCDNGDCAPSHTCTMFDNDVVGVCLGDIGGSGSGGGGGAGGGGGGGVTGCDDTPETAPSQGSCVPYP